MVAIFPIFGLVTAGWGFLDENCETTLERSARSMKELADYAFDEGVFLVLEALQADESNIIHTASEIKNYLDQVDSKGLKVCIDFGAMARAGDSLADYFNLLGDKIAHIHFVDGQPTGHLALGDGTRDLYEDLDSLVTYGYQGNLVLETVNSCYYPDPAKADAQSYQFFEKYKKERRCQ